MNAKKYIYLHLYILENSRKITMGGGGVNYIQRKKRRKGRKINSLHQEDKIAIFAMFVLGSITLF